MKLRLRVHRLKHLFNQLLNLCLTVRLKGSKGIFSFRWRLLLLVYSLLTLNSCSRPKESELEVKISPSESIILEMNAYSCSQIIEGIRTSDGLVTPAIGGPVALFNRITLKWSKTSKLYINQAKIKFTGAGIQGGSTTCELTPDLPYYFESTGATQKPVNIFSGGAFNLPGTVTSNSRCRVACSIPLANLNVPEIAASAELTVKATEVTNEGEDNEKYFRVKSKYRLRLVP